MGIVYTDFPASTESMTTDEILSVIQDFKNGYRIKQRRKGKVQWQNVTTDTIDWNFQDYQYCSKKPTNNICVNCSISSEQAEKLNTKIEEMGETISGFFKNDLKKIILNFIGE